MANVNDPILTALARQGFRFKKEMGQNFLFNAFVLEQIADSAGIEPGDIVIEAGAGAGTLTSALTARGARVFAVELDRALIPFLRSRFKDDSQVEVVQGDVLKLDLDAIAENKSYKLCANLPYNISTSFITMAFRQLIGLEAGAVTLQKETAEKVIAQPGQENYGMLALAAAWFGDVRLVMTLSPDYFYPKPPVDSAVVAFHRLPRDTEVNAQILWQVIRGLFNQRRKNLLNGFKTIKTIAPLRGEGWPGVLEETGIDYQRRPETLSLTEFIAIVRTAGY